MAAGERREAARANQRAAAFIRFQMLNDHEAMSLVLTEIGPSETARLSFVTALASIGGNIAARAFGRQGALDYLQSVATSSALLSEADDIDRFFDEPGT